MAHTYDNTGGRLVKRAFLALVVLTCVKVWLDPGAVTTPAQAQPQMFDSGAQRKLLLEEARKTNRLLGETLEVLKSGVLNVRVQGTDKKATGPDRTRASNG